MKLDKNKLNTIGVDRIKLYVELISVNTEINVDIYSVATDKAKMYYRVYDEATGTYINLSGLNYRKVITGENVTSDGKDNVSYGLDMSNRSKVVLDVVLPRVVYGTIHNVYNVIDREVIIESMECIVEELKAEGIEINDPEEWEVYSMEVNKTIIADKPLISYREGILWLLDNAFLKGYTKEDNDYKKRLSDNSISNTYYYGTKRINKKIYDKTGQIKDNLNIYIKENLIRSELTYNKEAINKTFKSIYLYDVLNKEKIEKSYNKATAELGDYLNEFTEEAITNLEAQFTKANFKEIDRVYKENAKRLFDIVFLVEAARKVYKGYGNNKFSRDIKKLLKCYDNSLYGKYRELYNILIAFNSSIEATNFYTLNKKFF